MKTTLLLAALLGCATLGHAQTAPASPSAGTNQAASGTKNVGADRADAPQAPGMQSSSTTPTAAGRMKGSKGAGRRGTRPKAPASQPMDPKQ